VYNGSKPDTCVSGKITVTKEGDSCDSVAIANSISGATLYYIWLPQPCTIHIITVNETCADLAIGTSFKSLVDWNLMLDSRCTILGATNPF
jgi:hypothetical protein